VDGYDVPVNGIRYVAFLVVDFVKGFSVGARGRGINGRERVDDGCEPG
jgi:hypothetical protein